MNDRFSGVNPSTTSFRPDELLSEHQVTKREWMPYTWQRLFAMIRIMRIAGVLDNDISWEETCSAYYRGVRPECYNFKDMADSRDKRLSDG